jgi:hypothetical protein
LPNFRQKTHFQISFFWKSSFDSLRLRSFLARLLEIFCVGHFPLEMACSFGEGIWCLPFPQFGALFLQKWRQELTLYGDL